MPRKGTSAVLPTGSPFGNVCVVSREKGRTDVVDRYTARVERIQCRWNGQEIAEEVPSSPDHLHPKLLLGSR